MSKRVWTKEHSNLLIKYVEEGIPQKEIAKLLGRTRPAISCRVAQFKDKNLVAKIAKLPWTEQEDEILYAMDKDGKTDKEIAWELGRDAPHVTRRRMYLVSKGYVALDKYKIRIEKEMVEMIKLREEGWTYTKIALKYCYQPETIAKRFRDRREKNGIN